MRSRPVFNPLALNNTYAVSQEVRFKFLYDTAYASAHYSHSCIGFLPATANLSNSGFVQTIKSCNLNPAILHIAPRV